MAKHRKTRQEKMIADQRHVLYHLETASPTQSEKPRTKQESYKLEIPTTSPKVITQSYAYVTADLKKTGLVTAAIIIAQIFLFIIINQM